MNIFLRLIFTVLALIIIAIPEPFGDIVGGAILIFVWKDTIK